MENELNKDEFRSIDPSIQDWSKAFWAQKKAAVNAEWVAQGTEVITVMKDGHIETKNVAPEGGAYKITNPDGEAYLISPAKFEARYELEEGNKYRPKWSPIEILPVEGNISFTAPWGELMKIKNGVLARTSPQDIYGIQPEEFASTYQILGRVNEMEKPNTRQDYENYLKTK